jgi:quercetin dioxygenase-like cupin family protein
MRGGPVWGTASEDLNVTKLAWPAGHSVAEHVADRDVAYVLLEGAMTLTVDGELHDLSAGDVQIVAKGTRRLIVAGSQGVVYVTAHRRRGGLQIRGLSAARD